MSSDNKCGWFNHDFGKWEPYKQYICEEMGVVLIVQKKCCNKCGKIKLRKERS